MLVLLVAVPGSGPGAFTKMAAMATPRIYHSVSILMPDGRALSVGGGLCAGCGTDHTDAEVHTPPYLLDAQGNLRARRAIFSSPATAAHGTQVMVRTDRTVARFALV